jgi:hypothetical protein
VLAWAPAMGRPHATSLMRNRLQATLVGVAAETSLSLVGLVASHGSPTDH